MPRRRNPPSAKERREQVQDILMSALGTAFYQVSDDRTLPEAEKEVLIKEMSRQMERIERLFGYDPGSWPRG